ISIFGKNKQILHHLTNGADLKERSKKNITHIFRRLASIILKRVKIIFGIRFSLYICIVASESSSVGRAQPCQGWGRGFESRLSLSCSDGGTGRHAGLKILFPLKECGFDSRSEYNKSSSFGGLLCFDKTKTLFLDKRCIYCYICYVNPMFSGCSVARYRASMGCWRSSVQIRPSRRFLKKSLSFS